MKVAGLVLCIMSLALVVLRYNRIWKSTREIANPIERPGWSIVTAEKAADGQFPHQILLRRHNYHLCGGSILDETTVLSAAYCVMNGGRGLNIVTGTNKVSSGGDVYKVKSVKLHEDYDVFQYQQDIAIIKLESPIQFNTKVQPIKLRQSFIEEGETATLSGWGSTYSIGPSPDDLQFIDLITVSTMQCRRDQPEPILESQICTFTQGRDCASHGDFGSPLIDSNGEQIGIFAWGTPCVMGQPDIFTRTFAFLDWIEANK